MATKTSKNQTIFCHRRVQQATYRIRKMRNKELFSVVEYYKGDRIQLCDNNLTFDESTTLANKLADRDEF